VTVLVDTSVLVDYLRGDQDAAQVLEQERAAAPLRASEITRLEVLAGIRPAEEEATRSLLSTLIWHPLDAAVAEEAGALGRQWLHGHHNIDGADLAIAAIAVRTASRLLDRLVVIREPVLVLASSEEKELVDQVLRGLSGKGAAELSAESHDEMGWRMVDCGETIPPRESVPCQDQRHNAQDARARP
jgi:hypothetical protein